MAKATKRCQNGQTVVYLAARMIGVTTRVFRELQTKNRILYSPQWPHPNIGKLVYTPLAGHNTWPHDQISTLNPILKYNTILSILRLGDGYGARESSLHINTTLRTLTLMGGPITFGHDGSAHYCLTNLKHCHDQGNVTLTKWTVEIKCTHPQALEIG